MAESYQVNSRWPEAPTASNQDQYGFSQGEFIGWSSKTTKNKAEKRERIVWRKKGRSGGQKVKKKRGKKTKKTGKKAIRLVDGDASGAQSAMRGNK